MLTNEMLKFSTLTPDAYVSRVASCKDDIFGSNRTPNEVLPGFGIRVSRDMASTSTAYILASPAVKVGRGESIPDDPNNPGAWNFRNRKVADKIPLRNFAVVDFANGDAERFAGEFANMMTNMGINAVPLANVLITKANPVDAETALKDMFVKGSSKPNPPQFILCILPDDGVPLYATIKRVCDVELEIITQCVVVGKIRGPQYWGNVVLKVNTKLGGINHYVEPLENFVPVNAGADGVTMIVGVDATHPNDRRSAKPSIASVVASMDTKATRYTTNISLVPARRDGRGANDIISKEIMQEMIESHLTAFEEQNGVFPARIVVYRDG
ncbi:Protein argonaute 10 [Nowakowskiella sp. JEL0078]|nr:Protein argonaute 10 [Nowakowskiella sp. JEL0078]